MANVKNIDITLDIHDEFDIFMDSYELERVIDNTLSNAIKYGFEDSNIDIILNIQEDIYKLEIKNEGIQIADIKTIFDAYYQQKEKNVGFGLGLSIVKDICSKYNIDIAVSSVNNQTSFSYLFPKNLLLEEEII
jgi:two-component system, sensor histidine kinase and response regulator